MSAQPKEADGRSLEARMSSIGDREITMQRRGSSGSSPIPSTIAASATGRAATRTAPSMGAAPYRMAHLPEALREGHAPTRALPSSLDTDPPEPRTPPCPLILRPVLHMHDRHGYQNTVHGEGARSTRQLSISSRPPIPREIKPGSPPPLNVYPGSHATHLLP